ncbi:hypothetical protein B0T26DRAFT_690839 [Lasiosphaeria miniovina]|uniref:Uncharacterized protein n=1 Tax=Lasiosphaeria miniovina TaxID=1954250 RepID=A0AA40EB70_9PEZI|nr:uncharacterized protein B0T26DRAFT_690839 [Lasiosphaeria miniovina]KAK0735109.1 hypothetical protein B0T26DRAFT_690839 [Lasiosphaeria miniovina]
MASMSLFVLMLASLLTAKAAKQIEILTCLQWLGEFQILACIPLEGSVPVRDVADLSGVPGSQLGRVVRLTATCGFLDEPQPGFVAHTPLSAHFIANQRFLDAAMFLAESAAPTALQMATATQRFGPSRRPSESAYNLALNTIRPFHVARIERPKLNRQWAAYLHNAAGLLNPEELAQTLSQLNWSNLSHACIVEVGAPSTSMARCLADLYPSARITVADRAAGARSPADASVFIFHLPSASPPLLPGGAILAQLQEFLSVLRACDGVMLILTSRLLPEPGSLPDPNVEAVARARDLGMGQLANEGEMEMAELFDLLGSVKDSVGKLVVTHRLRSNTGLVVAVAVKHQAFVDPPDA